MSLSCFPLCVLCLQQQALGHLEVSMAQQQVQVTRSKLAARKEAMVQAAMEHDKKMAWLNKIVSVSETLC